MENKIILVDKKDFEEKIKKFKLDGNLNLLIVADFGRTFSKCFLPNKEKVSTSFSVMRNKGYLGEEYKKTALEYFNKYHPIEVNPDIPNDIKVKPLTEWWKLHMELLVKSGFDLDIIKDIIKNGNIPLREGIPKFLESLNKNKIPLVIVSQGLGDLYIESIKNIDKYFENIYFVSNLFEFDESGKAKKVKETIVHPYNKNKINLKKFNFYEKIKQRKNLLLLGDSLEDLGVIENLNYNNLIKIGFLNEKIEENLKKYKENFDVVILDDSDMNYVNETLMKIVEN